MTSLEQTDVGGAGTFDGDGLEGNVDIDESDATESDESDATESDEGADANGDIVTEPDQDDEGDNAGDHEMDEDVGAEEDSDSDDLDFKVVYESDNEDILLYEEDSDDEVRKRNVVNPKYDPKVSTEKYMFQLGMEFPNLKDFKHVARSYSVDGGYPIQFVVNEKERCQAKCPGGCPWKIWCSKIKGEITFQVKTYVQKHRCNRSLPNKQANTSWLTVRLLDKIKNDPKVSVGKLVVYVKENMSLSISKTHAFRSKKKALEIIDGKHQEQYGKLRSYLAEVMRTNPGSTCNITVDKVNLEEPAVFKRVYMCLTALRDGFLAGYRPLIGLDGCLLKTAYGGQLLTAVSQDGNNSMFLIAWVVDERENGDSWDWFIRKLLHDIGGLQSKRWCFISDRQKGLVQAMEGLSRESQQTIEHRFCVRHIYANFSKQWPGAQYRLLVYDCAKSTIIPQFNDNMMKVKELDEAAWKYLNDIEPCLWTRAAFSIFSKNASIVNNMSESFNGKILPFRDRPIITMLEELRGEAMYMFRLQMAQKYGKLVPLVRSQLDQECVKSRKWTTKWIGDLTEINVSGYQEATSICGKC
ncbi:uncharacterized protein LOC120009283 isoform X2 [Tripterygium wilfordii]|uniref:uncharacterized protein LOC120009283 isoform X2 n=1 Tax=Tripterygium wilfordii TaxID=458696 RepID=UPI0018F855AB|nr:uncharacterized protein LOC120009283 isoform X2 [Tripterygium wilfordii]